MPTSSIFSALPAELIHFVFHLAAAHDHPTALALARVSSWAQRSTEPALFHTVVLRSSPALAAFLTAISHRPTAPVRVAHLAILALGPADAISRVLAACPRLSSLALTPACPLVLSPTRHPTLCSPPEQHLIGPASRASTDSTFLSPTVTHLRVSLTSSDPSPHPLLAALLHLSALTHLAIICRPVLAPSIHAALHTLPRLRVLLVQLIGADFIPDKDKDADAGDHEDERDPRMVVERAPLSVVRQWEDAKRAGAGVWDAAERVVDARCKELEKKKREREKQCGTLNPLSIRQLRTIVQM